MINNASQSQPVLASKSAIGEAEPSAGCGCISWVNEGLAKQNAGLVTTMFRKPEITVISTYKLDSKKRSKLPMMLASYCPFCGEKYAENTGVKLSYPPADTTDRPPQIPGGTQS